MSNVKKNHDIINLQINLYKYYSKSICTNHKTNILAFNGILI